MILDNAIRLCQARPYEIGFECEKKHNIVYKRPQIFLRKMQQSQSSNQLTAISLIYDIKLSHISMMYLPIIMNHFDSIIEFNLFEKNHIYYSSFAKEYDYFCTDMSIVYANDGVVYTDKEVIRIATKDIQNVPEIIYKKTFHYPEQYTDITPFVSQDPPVTNVLPFGGLYCVKNIFETKQMNCRIHATLPVSIAIFPSSYTIEEDLRKIKTDIIYMDVQYSLQLNEIKHIDHDTICMNFDVIK